MSMVHRNFNEVLWLAKIVSMNPESVTYKTLQRRAQQIIAEGITGFQPATRSVSLQMLEAGMIDETMWEVYGYTLTGKNSQPESVELLEVMKPTSCE